MRIGAVVQARMSSRRLPGKVLRPLAGRPLVAHLFERLARADRLDGTVLATSTAPEDDALDAFAEARDLPCHRGPLDDVAARLLGAAEVHGFDAVVRVNGDSPLLDPALVSRGVRLFRDRGAELVTNVFPRSYPKGQSVEVIATDLLARIVSEATVDDREHVTRHVYRHSGQFGIRNFTLDPPCPDLQLSVDTAEDLRRIERIMGAAVAPIAEMPLSEILALAGAPCEEAGAP